MGMVGKAEMAALHFAGAMSMLGLAAGALIGSPLVILGEKTGLKALGYAGAAPCMAFAFLAKRVAERLDRLEKEQKAPRPKV